jgi:hypothetical protein
MGESTALGALGGIVLAALLAFLTTRINRNREQEDQKRSFRNSLIGPLEAMLEHITREDAYIRKHRTTNFPIVDYFAIYRNTHPKIGDLTPTEALCLSRCYIVYQERLSYIINISGDKQSQLTFGRSFTLNFTELGKEREMKEVLHQLFVIQRHTIRAIRAIKSRLR